MFAPVKTGKTQGFKPEFHSVPVTKYFQTKAAISVHTLNKSQFPSKRVRSNSGLGPTYLTVISS